MTSVQTATSRETGPKFDYPLIIASLAILIGFVILMVAVPDRTLEALNNVFDSGIGVTGPILEVFTLACVIVSFFLIFSRYGHIRLGEGRPEYNTFSYIAMMTLAALASAALFWSFTEWAYYYDAPGIGMEPRSTEALESSLGYAFFHWGLSGQAIYVVIAAAIAYGYYVRKVPTLQASAVFGAMMGNRTGTKAGGKFIDFAVIFGVVGGLGSSLGLAVPLAGGALQKVFGIEQAFPVQLAIVIVIALVFTFTSFIGTKKGMQYLSNVSAVLCIALLAYIFFAGPTTFIVRNTVNSFGWMLAEFPRMSLFMDPVEDTGFVEAWTLFFQAFYLNYAALMGIFIAKISRGRTMREMAMASLFGISIGSWAIFAINSSFAIKTHLDGTTDIVAESLNGTGEVGIYQVLDLLPGGAVVLPLILLIIIVGFVASTLDTGSLALAQTTQRQLDKNGDVKPLFRVFWCGILTLVPLSIMFAKADFNALKIVSILVSFPFMVVIAVLIVGLFRWFREDTSAGHLDPLMESDAFSPTNPLPEPRPSRLLGRAVARDEGDSPGGDVETP